ncbi:MAG: outer membrane beta-barrel protein [Hyphomonadaceae bacterium]|nr:outer membrane beta-barrel protein [Hyphomonadaceae bacterium]
MLKTATAIVFAATAGCLLAPSAAQADITGNSTQPEKYVFIGGGAGITGQLDTEDGPNGGVFSGFDDVSGFDDTPGADLETGFQVFGGFGVQNVLFPGLRLELEGLFANNGLDDFDNLQTRTVGGFGNLLYQIKLGPVQPYVGGGAGWGSSRVELDDDAGEIGFNDGDPNVSDGGFMWQAKAGFAVPVRRNLTIDIGYRYFNGAEIEDVAVFDPLTNVTANSNLDPAVHAINLGLRFRFGGAEAGPVRRY